MRVISRESAGLAIYLLCRYVKETYKTNLFSPSEARCKANAAFGGGANIVASNPGNFNQPLRSDRRLFGCLARLKAGHVT